jgi:probable phosphoglycerate mutase
MSILILVRHGEAQNNTKDVLTSSINGYPLTKRGVEQAEATASQLKTIKISGMFSSPLERTMQTAKIINRYHGMDIKADARLRELSFGRLEGSGAMKGLWEIEMLRSRKLEKSMEKGTEVAARMFSFIRTLPPDGTYIAVTHQSCIDNTVRKLIGMDEFSGNGISVKNATVTVLEKEHGRLRILAIGSFSVDNTYLKALKSKRGAAQHYPAQRF